MMFLFTRWDSLGWETYEVESVENGYEIVRFVAGEVTLKLRDRGV